MSDFDDAVDEMYEGSSQADIRAVVRPLYFFDFIDHPIYLWSGQGRLTTSDGRTWLGTIDAFGRDHLVAPGFNDGRDGSSAVMEFRLPYLDRETYQSLKADRWRIEGRPIIRYVAAFKFGEGLRPSTPIDFDAKFYMAGTQFNESLSMVDGVMVREYPVTVTAKNGNAGRSQARRGTYTPTSQRSRSLELYGIANDKGCDFVPELANKTFIRP